MSRTVKSQRFILVVEDDIQLREIIARSLQKAGYLVFQAATFREAVNAISVKPHLMILDINLPDATGWEVAEWLESFTTLVPIIVMSGATTPTPRQLQQFTPKAFLAKPFDIEELFDLVEKYAAPS